MTDASMVRAVDGRVFRNVLGHFPTGVALVAGRDPDGTPVGMAVGSFTSVSLDPPLVAFLPDKKSSTFPKLRKCDTFVVNVLAASQERVCRTFASKDVADKWAGTTWHPAPGGAPILDGCVAWIECDFETIHEAGDHYIVLGKVRSMGVGDDLLPLLFFQGGYGGFSPGSLVAGWDRELLPAMRLADLARDELERVAADTGLECLVQAQVGDELVIVAGAAPSRRNASPTRVGVRTPYVPPFGAIFAAWGDEDVIERWMSRLSWRPDTEQRAAYRRMLETVRRRGWSLALAPMSDGLAEAIDAFADGAASTAKEARLRELLEQVVTRYEPEDLTPGESYDVRFLAAPVRGPGGRVEIVLRLYQLPPRMDFGTLQFLAERLVQAAKVVEALAGYTDSRD